MMGFKFREVEEIKEAREDRGRRQIQESDLAKIARSIQNKEMNVEELDKPICFDVRK